MRMLISALPLLCSSAVLAGDEATTVNATGQAAIVNDDAVQARDRAIQDAHRKAVEQAVGAMVSSETVTANFELLSDKIFSKSKGYVRKYDIIKESKADGIFQVEIKAQVATGDLKGDIDGVLALLQSKNMPRMLVMISEQNVGQKDPLFAVSLNSVENIFMDAWMPKGIEFVDRQALMGKLSVGPAVAMGGDPNAIKEFGMQTGADIVIIGQAVATDAGSIEGTSMRSVRANVSVRALNVDNGSILASSTVAQGSAHIDGLTAGTMAFEKSARKIAEELLEKILAKWQTEVAGPSKVKLVIKNVQKSKMLADLATALRNNVRGVQNVRQRSYKAKVAELEIEMAGSAQDLAGELESKKFPGFQLEIDEFTANTVTASLR